jgi:hypothetical protein
VNSIEPVLKAMCDAGIRKKKFKKPEADTFDLKYYCKFVFL